GWRRMMKRGPRATRPGPDYPLLLLRLGDLAAFGRAVGGRRLGVSLSLAGVLAGTGVTTAGAAALPLAGVDPVADHLIAAALLVAPAGHAPRPPQRPRPRTHT